MSLYQTLGVGRDAAADAIKKAYRKLAHKHHPDKGGDVSQFQAVQKAYDILSDAERRRRYDESGDTNEAPSMRQQCLQTLAQMVLAEIDATTDIARLNIIANIRLKVSGGISLHKQQITVVQKKIEKRKRAIDRLMKTGDGENWFVQILEGDNRMQQTVIDGLNTGIAQGEEMLSILAEYDYRLDAAPTAQDYQEWLPGWAPMLGVYGHQR